MWKRFVHAKKEEVPSVNFRIRVAVATAITPEFLAIGTIKERLDWISAPAGKLSHLVTALWAATSVATEIDATTHPTSVGIVARTA